VLESLLKVLEIFKLMLILEYIVRRECHLRSRASTLYISNVAKFSSRLDLKDAAVNVAIRRVLF
jgi:hypothetical protein